MRIISSPGGVFFFVDINTISKQIFLLRFNRKNQIGSVKINLIFSLVSRVLQIICALSVGMANVGIIIGRRNIDLQALSLFHKESIFIKAKVQFNYAVFLIVTKLIAKRGYQEKKTAKLFSM